MDNKTKFREAFKVGLAFALVYGIAMKISWMNPNWAAFGVAMIALPTQGQSLNKGLNRVAGTIPGCIAALVIFGISPQNRWLFFLLAGLWLGFTTYKMLRSKNHAYFWNVAGFVSLIILISSPLTSYNIFYHALYRTLETAMGVMTYTLISVFLWPITNFRSINKTSKELLSVQLARFKTTIAVIDGKEKPEKLNELQQQNIQNLSQLNAALLAEGAESYKVREVKPLLERFYSLSSSLLDTQNHFESSLEEFSKVDFNKIFPGFSGFTEYIEDRFQDMQAAIDGNSVGEYSEKVHLEINKQAILQYDALEKAALEVGYQNFKRMYTLSKEMYACVMDLTGNKKAVSWEENANNINHRKSGWIFMPDRYALQSALFAILLLFFGFCVWIFFNPTGHASWFQMAGTIAMVIVSMPQMKINKAVPAVALVFPLGILCYVFIMPRLSTYFELAILLFTAMFLVHYFIPASVRVFGQLAIINMMAIQNHQVYSFAAVFNGYLFTLAVITFCYAASYLISTPRPEKVVLKSIHRFFTYSEYLLSKLTSGKAQTLLGRWRTAYIHKELQKIPGKISQWSKAIDHKLFPDITPDQINLLVTSLQGLVYRIDELFEAEEMSDQRLPEKSELIKDLKSWNTGLIQAFSEWSVQPGSELYESRKETINTWLEAFDKKLEDSISKTPVQIPEKELEQIYTLLGSYRGLSLATINYARIAPGINWNHWKEERFS